MPLLAETDGVAIQREMGSFVPYVLLYRLKDLFGMESINALPALLFNDEALMPLVGFNAQQVRQGVSQLGATTWQGARPRGGVCSAEPQLLNGLLWCGRHEVPVRLSSMRRGAAGQYQCDDDYDNGQADHACTLLDARVLDDPITDVILRHCQFIEHTEAVLAQLEAEYDSTREEARRRQRERRRLQEEVDTLKQNLALTRAQSM